MSPSQKINLEERAYPVYMICELYKITPEQYISPEDIMIHIANREYKTLTEIEDNDSKTAGLIKERGLEKDVQDFLLEKEEI